MADFAKIEEARKAGYSDDEIYGYLKKDAEDNGIDQTAFDTYLKENKVNLKRAKTGTAPAGIPAPDQQNTAIPIPEPQNVPQVKPTGSIPVPQAPGEVASSVPASKPIQAPPEPFLRGSPAEDMPAQLETPGLAGQSTYTPAKLSLIGEAIKPVAQGLDQAFETVGASYREYDKLDEERLALDEAKASGQITPEDYNKQMSAHREKAIGAGVNELVGLIKAGTTAGFSPVVIPLNIAVKSVAKVFNDGTPEGEKKTEEISNIIVADIVNAVGVSFGTLAHLTNGMDLKKAVAESWGKGKGVGDILTEVVDQIEPDKMKKLNGIIRALGELTNLSTMILTGATTAKVKAEVYKGAFPEVPIDPSQTGMPIDPYELAKPVVTVSDVIKTITPKMEPMVDAKQAFVAERYQPKLNEDLQAVAEAIPGTVVKGTPKSTRSIIQKMAKEKAEKGTPEEVSFNSTADNARGRIVLPDPQDLGITIRQLKHRGYNLEDAITAPKPSGYKGVFFNKEMADGIGGEIQIHYPESLGVKGKYDPLNRATRILSQRDIDSLSPAERVTLENNVKAMKAEYESLWKQPEVANILQEAKMIKSTPDSWGSLERMMEGMSKTQAKRFLKHITDEPGSKIAFVSTPIPADALVDGLYRKAWANINGAYGHEFLPPIPDFNRFYEYAIDKQAIRVSANEVMRTVQETYAEPFKAGLTDLTAQIKKEVGNAEEILPPLTKKVTKSSDSLADKVARKIVADQPQYNLLSPKDHVRASISVNSWKDLPQAIEVMKKNGWELEIKTPGDFFNYHGLHMNKRIGSIAGMKGEVGAEIQMHTPESWKLKLAGDKAYEKWRPYAEKALNELTPLQKAELHMDMAEINAGWERYVKQMPLEFQSKLYYQGKSTPASVKADFSAGESGEPAMRSPTVTPAGMGAQTLDPMANQPSAPSLPEKTIEPSANLENTSLPAEGLRTSEGIGIGNPPTESITKASLKDKPLLPDHPAMNDLANKVLSNTGKVYGSEKELLMDMKQLYPAEYAQAMAKYRLKNFADKTVSAKVGAEAFQAVLEKKLVNEQKANQKAVQFKPREPISPAEVPAEVPKNIETLGMDQLTLNPGKRQFRAEAVDVNRAKQMKENYDPALDEPITVWRHDGINEILDGHTRYEMHRQLGSKTINARIFKGTEAEATKIARQLNAVQKGYTPLEEAGIFDKEMQEGVSLPDIAKKYQRSEGYVQKLTELNNLSGEMKDFLQRDILDLKHALVIGKMAKKWEIAPETQNEFYHEWIKKGQITPATLEMMINEFMPSIKKDMAKASSDQGDFGFNIIRGITGKLKEFESKIRELEKEKSAYKGVMKVVDKANKAGTPVEKTILTAYTTMKRKTARLEKEVAQMKKVIGKSPQKAELTGIRAPDEIPAPPDTMITEKTPTPVPGEMLDQGVMPGMTRAETGSIPTEAIQAKVPQVPNEALLSEMKNGLPEPEASFFDAPKVEVKTPAETIQAVVKPVEAKAEKADLEFRATERKRIITPTDLYNKTEKALEYGYKKGLETAEKVIKTDLLAQKKTMSEVKTSIKAYAKELLGGNYIDKTLANIVSGATDYNSLSDAFVKINMIAGKRARQGVVDDIGNILDNLDRIDVGNQRAIKDVMDGIDLRNHTDKWYMKGQKIQDFLERQGTPLDEMPKDLQARVLGLENKTLEDFSTSELINLKADLAKLYDQGMTKLRMKNEIKTLRAQIAIKKIQDTARNFDRPYKTREIGKPDNLTLRDRFNNKVYKMKDQIQAGDWAMTTPDRFFDILDGGKNYQGGMYKVFKDPVDRAVGDGLNIRDKIMEPANKLFNELKLEDHNFERIGLYALIKRPGGLEKLQFTLGELETAKVLKDLKLSEAEMKMYNFMRETYDGMFPHLRKLKNDLSNEELYQSKNYFPFKTDFENKMTATEFITENYRKALPEMGFLKDVVGGKQAIQLNAWKIFTSHIDRTSYALGTGRVLDGLNRIMNRGVKSNPALMDAIGLKGYNYTKDWVDMVARKGNSMDAFQSNILDFLRKNTGQAVMLFKVTTLMKQFLAHFNGASEIGKWEWVGSRDVYTPGNVELRKFVTTASPQMRTRIGDDIAYLESGSLFKGVQDAGRALLTKADYMPASATWVGAYKQFLHKAGKEFDMKNIDRDAVAYADRTVRLTQSTSQFKDIAPVLRNSLGKTFFQFQSFVMNNWNYLKHDLAKLGIQDPKKASQQIFWLTVALLVEAGIDKGAYNLFTKKKDEPDEKNLALATVQTLAGNIPGVNQALTFTPLNTREFAPVLQTFKDIGTGGYGTIKAFAEGEPEKAVKPALRFAQGVAQVAGVPGTTQAGQLIRKALPEPGDVPGSAMARPIKQPERKTGYQIREEQQKKRELAGRRR